MQWQAERDTALASHAQAMKPMRMRSVSSQESPPKAESALVPRSATALVSLKLPIEAAAKAGSENGTAAGAATCAAVMTVACARTLHASPGTRCVLEHAGTGIHCSKLEPLNERARMHRAGLAFASMSQNNTPTLYAGIDVAKATLDLSLAGARQRFTNDAAGHRKLLGVLQKAGGNVHAILEATGGYEASLAGSLHAAGVALSVLQPARVRYCARALNQHAKTDPIDADVLAAFGHAVRPAPMQPPRPEVSRLAGLVTRRQQLVEAKVAQDNQAAHYTEKLALRQARQMSVLLQKQIAQCERAIAAQIAADEDMSRRSARMRQVKGVGEITAATLLAHMPELGGLSAEAAAALAGVAPYNHDSGPFKGTRSIRGGRREVRCALYMAALSAVRHDAILRSFYQRLRAAGKKPLVALTAAMRKLIILLNHLLKNPSFELAQSRT